MRLRDALACLSFANLCFLQVWAELDDTRAQYFRKLAPGFGELAGLMLDILLLAAACWLLVALAGSFRGRAATTAGAVLLLGAMLVPLRNIRLQLPVLSFQNVRHLAGWAGVALLAALIAAVTARWPRRVSQASAVFLLVMAPLVALNIGRTLLLMRPFGNEVAAAADGPPPRRSGPRVVVALFDELDYRLVFVKRPPGLALPQLDRLRSESVFALNAYPAAHDTLESIPSILTGRPVATAVPDGSDDLELDPGRAAARWSRVPTIFSHARAAGFRTALVGWYHPYCRVLGSSLDECFWEPGGSLTDMPEYARRLPLIDNMRLQVIRQLAVLPVLRPTDRPVSRLEHAREYTSIDSRAMALGSDSTYGLVFLHYPIPHPPGVYSPAKSDLDPGPPHAYADNLPLVDRAVGELRQAMERSGAWDASTLILTADHPLRMTSWPEEAERWGPAGSPLVPLLIKLPGERGGSVYAPAINNRVLYRLVPALLAGTVATPPQLLSWLDRN